MPSEQIRAIRAIVFKSALGVAVAASRSLRDAWVVRDGFCCRGTAFNKDQT